METNTAAVAEITLTNANGKVIAFVNGTQIAATKDTDGFIGRIESKLRAARVYRQTGYEFVAGVFVAQGQMVA